jgi:uncharacterized protein YceH (UPF0502 family)
VELGAVEIRVLGCLVEKEAATPDLYPLSTNALVAACNQRSSRDPVVSYDEAAVTAALRALRELGLARTSRGDGSRVYRHAHTLREALGLDADALALVSVLMLRGAQTSGELRSRAERQHAFASLGEVEDALLALARREPPLVARLERRPGHKEARWTQLLGAGSSGAQANREQPASGWTSAGVTPAAPSEPERGEDELALLRLELERLRVRVDALERRLGS